MQKIPIEIKGSNFTLLVLYLNTDNIDLINAALYKKIQEFPQFFKNAPIIVNVSSVLSETKWKKIQKIIIKYNLFIVGVSGCKNTGLKKVIIDSGLPVLSEFEKEHMHQDANVFYKNYISKKIKKEKKTHIVNKPVRSGQKIYAKHSDLIVINNVSAGAEIVADGNVHIYGSVRGRVLAGANGDITSQIFCSALFAELISVSGEYWLSDQIPSKFIGQATQIYLKNKLLTISFLN
ncbi:septum site-determining protein MinC [Buchnera aphidicola (Melanaphis sacchari)]|uniref:Probable septum site-determining protein MinC n=1 Tax=Buchnera aphidicola (Melanaphis sacchari) TaxID=2173854 RepID=A0A2U8DGS1_9GAMM|nr:septum site-determining protein MinC [Buchnera aphidicola]AWH90464.1 septum site-determining protein MinC [Buchnera aphidicola (Melanaphis sacchari)]